ncbi:MULTISPECIES: hypothetical protein [Chryseobacterium]|uniref:Uncharacterized protein n=1 Tax=Chryseobacterium oryzae TaxID=2929799 RepID=A0ABY4BHT1_9FLAO|nr:MULTISPECIES: hypothetical protein [Chryseobacterium]UOE38733.1 hypothetical protein MTP08_02860 [Chryseobacterium oryzae]
MKRFFSFFLVLAMSLVFGQKTLDAKILTADNDTLKVKIKVRTNAFDPDLLYVTSFNTKVTSVDENGKKVKIEIPKIKELSLIDFYGKKRFFINKSDDNKVLLERMYDSDNVEWFRNYSSTMGGENANDFLFNKKTNKGVGFIYFTGLPKKRLKEFFADEPEMLKIVDDIRKDGGFSHTSDYDNAMINILENFDKIKNNK